MTIFLETYGDWTDALALHEHGVACLSDCDTDLHLGFRCVRCGLYLYFRECNLDNCAVSDEVYSGWLAKCQPYAKQPSGAIAWTDVTHWMGIFRPWLDSLYYVEPPRPLSMLDGVLLL